MRTLIVFLFLTVYGAAHAALDRIDADGTTERGGSPEYARMIPRTKSDGRLDMSLLPPVADWASQPIPGLYYVAAGATVSGNGSPQYPFNTLSSALSAAVTGSALVVSPGSYSGTYSLDSSKTVSICGFGHATYITSLSVAVTGSAVLRLCGLKVGTLTVSGGTLNVILSGAAIEVLGGTASGITVTRTDMGSTVVAAGRSYMDVYAGHNTVDRARALSGDAGMTLTFYGERLVTPAGTVAYTSDVYNAVADIRTGDIAPLVATADSLTAQLDTERETRSSEDADIRESMRGEIDSMNTRIGNIGDDWNERLNTVARNVSSLNTAVSDLRITETGNITAVYARIESVRREAADANDTLESAIMADVGVRVSTLQDSIPSTADARAIAQIEAARPAIVEEAVEQANDDTVALLTVRDALINGARAAITELNETNRTQDTSIRHLHNTDTALGSRITALDNREKVDISGLRSSIESTVTAYKAADVYVLESATNAIAVLRADVPGIATTQANTAISSARYSIVSEAVEDANDYTDTKTSQVSTKVTNLESKITSVQRTVSTQADQIAGNSTDIADIETSVSDIDTRLDNHTSNMSTTIGSIQSWQTTMGGRVGDIESVNAAQRLKINEILNVLSSLKAGAGWNTITIPGNL